MNKPLTVARSVYKLLRDNGGKVNKAVVLEWDVPYEYKGQKLTANKDTVARTLRSLVEEGWLGQEERNGQAYYWTKADNKEVVKNTLPPEPVVLMRDGNKIAVPPEAAPNLLANGWIRV